MGDQLGGHAEDAFRAAVVPFQPHDVDVGKILLELENVVQIGPAPAVDRLVGIARDRQIGIIDRQRPGDGILGQVRVLIFVDEDEAIALVEVWPDFGLSRKHVATCSSRSSKSAALERGKLGLVSGIDLPGDHLPTALARPRLVLVGRDQVVLGPTDGPARPPRA